MTRKRFPHAEFLGLQACMQHLNFSLACPCRTYNAAWMFTCEIYLVIHTLFFTCLVY